MKVIQPPRALIFDMDGVLVDNLHFHLQSWIEFCANHGILITPDEFQSKMFGGTNKVLMERVFRRPLSKKEHDFYTNEKESLYRLLYEPHIIPLPGIRNFILAARKAGIMTAVATAGPKDNLSFVLQKTRMEGLFDVTLDDSDVKKGKPDPEIYLFTLAALKLSANECLVFEDSIMGVQAAQAAGIRVVGVTTSLDSQSLSHTWKTIPDFSAFTLNDLVSE